MPQQQQIQSRRRSEDEQPQIEPVKVESPEIDDILDEIDDVLEQNAEEFVKAYVQKGGE